MHQLVSSTAVQVLTDEMSAVELGLAYREPIPRNVLPYRVGEDDSQLEARPGCSIALYHSGRIVVAAKLPCTKSKVLNLLCHSDAGAWNPAYSVGRLVRAAITCWSCPNLRDPNLNLKAELLFSNLKEPPVESYLATTRSTPQNGAVPPILQRLGRKPE